MEMASSDGGEIETGAAQLRISKEKIRDMLWKAAAAALVVFLIYVFLHFGSQLIELQGS